MIITTKLPCRYCGADTRVTDQRVRGLTVYRTHTCIEPICGRSGITREEYIAYGQDRQTIKRLLQELTPEQVASRFRLPYDQVAEVMEELSTSIP